MKYFIIATMFLLLSGCSILSGITDKAGEINDEALNTAEFTICHGASVGSIRRHYGSPEKAKIWADLCNSVDDFNPDAN